MNYDQDELLFYADDEAAPESQQDLLPWRILVVDDDEEVHILTRLVLRDLIFEGKGVELISARSGQEARKILDSEQGIALVLLDVVMESDDAGLQLVHYIRSELANQAIRIILRTGQPGHAPEQQVIMKYDINDYKEKTELTSQKLVTAVIASLRSYLYIEQVVCLNQQLEDKVRVRTLELEEANIRLQTSLDALQEGEEAGKRIQFRLMPQGPLLTGGMRFDHLLLPSEFVSGDFVDYFDIDDRFAGFYMADVSGHGVASAFVTVYLKRFIMTLLEQYRHGENAQIVHPELLVQSLNQALLEEDLGKHVVIFYAVLDKLSGSMTYTNAGLFPWPLLVTQDGIHSIEDKGTPAGLFDFARYRSDSLTLPDSFALYLFSDGVLDILSEPSLDEKLRRLRGCLTPFPGSLSQLIRRLGVSEANQLPDDLALFSLARNPPA
ncbi:PP2C family protein-serine/threonine phosphatase [Bowmanella dokdonensis]|uniref:Fused response regulator/phosphatase n=1 Tax=Bowmanella dokdonensis TaxID=751969 RepID=A0A939DPH2_9ALTE|nr:fused response regulator/phosphatase [Bowmanella dokdonensis]MBN7825865.1 fused response regulator/phosphatase [Bowmanella dokdonensis]